MDFRALMEEPNVQRFCPFAFLLRHWNHKRIQGGLGGWHNPKIGENQKWKFSFFSVENNSMLTSFGKKLVTL